MRHKNRPRTSRSCCLHTQRSENVDKLLLGLAFLNSRSSKATTCSARTCASRPTKVVKPSPKSTRQDARGSLELPSWDQGAELRLFDMVGTACLFIILSYGGRDETRPRNTSVKGRNRPTKIESLHKNPRHFKRCRYISIPFGPCLFVKC